MKRLIIALLALAPFPALADDITITVTSATGATTQTSTFAAADMAEFEKWTAQAYPCTVVPPATTCIAFTQAESNAAWANATLQGTLDNVNRFRAREAATTAVGDLTPIEPLNAKKKAPATPAPPAPAKPPKK